MVSDFLRLQISGEQHTTVLAAVGIALPDDRITDGKDLLKVALDPEQPSLDRPLFWRTGGYKVV